MMQVVLEHYIYLTHLTQLLFKHFISTIQNYRDSDQSQISYVAGYFNTTSAIDEISFKFSSGNIDSGVIKLYGVS